MVCTIIGRPSNADSRSIKDPQKIVPTKNPANPFKFLIRIFQ